MKYGWSAQNERYRQRLILHAGQDERKLLKVASNIELRMMRAMEYPHAVADAESQLVPRVPGRDIAAFRAA